MKDLLRLLLILLSVTTLSCSESNEEFHTACGAVVDGTLRSPPEEKDGVFVHILSVPAPNQIVVADASNRTTLVLLQGVSEIFDPVRREAAIKFLESLDTEGWYFRADEEDDCTVTLNNVLFVPGEVLTQAGESFAEKLMLSGLGIADNSTYCDADLVNNCYFGLESIGQENHPYR